jgi:protein-disulfide isomerase/uncharacterized membrane protein
MYHSTSISGSMNRRILSFLFALGMMAASYLTIEHFFEANYPESIFKGAFYDISAFLNCDSSAFSSISQIYGIPLGYFGLFLGALVALGAVFPSCKFELTNSFLLFFNTLGVLGLMGYSILVLKSLCLLCTGYYIFSFLTFGLFAAYGTGKDTIGRWRRFFHPSLKMLVTFACAAAVLAYGMILYHQTRQEAQTGSAMKIVKQYYELPQVGFPSLISPYRTVSSAENFTDAPIQIVEYVDFLCPDCLYLHQQMKELKPEFKGKINIAFQFFPLEGDCNSVVEKDLHPGACELSYLAAAAPDRFVEIHDEIFAHFRAARDPEWRRQLADKYGVTGKMADPEIRSLVNRIIQTGAEYEKTSQQYAHGIRSTPTMIINGRMVIGTMPAKHLRAIFQALVEEQHNGKRFMENWIPTRKVKPVKSEK